MGPSIREATLPAPGSRRATTNYGVNTPLVAVGNGPTNVPTSFVLTNLTPGTTYHYRGVATNFAGTNFGLDMSFTTPAGAPVVTTLSVSNITRSEAHTSELQSR